MTFLDCPWVNNCVAFKNYKAFLLFLTYIVILSLVVLISLVPWFLERILRLNKFGSQEIQIMICGIIAFVFGLGLFFFAAAHWRMVFLNLTTLESIEGLSKKQDNVDREFD